MYPGSKLVWAKDAAGEIGKQPKPDSWETERYDEVMRSLGAHYATTKRGKR